MDKGQAGGSAAAVQSTRHPQHGPPPVWSYLKAGLRARGRRRWRLPDRRLPVRGAQWLDVGLSILAGSHSPTVAGAAPEWAPGRRTGFPFQPSAVWPLVTSGGGHGSRQGNV